MSVSDESIKGLKQGIGSLKGTVPGLGSPKDAALSLETKGKNGSIVQDSVELGQPNRIIKLYDEFRKTKQPVVKQYLDSDVNYTSFYNETMIIQVWDKYIKSKDLSYYYCDELMQSECYFSSLFDKKKNMKNAGLIVTSENDLYRRSDGSTVSVANVVNHEGGEGAFDAIIYNIKIALNQIALWNEKNKDKLIGKHNIIFPYHQTDIHWNLGVFELNIFKDSITGSIHAFDPYGGGSVSSSVANSIIDSVKEIFTLTAKKIKIERVERKFDEHPKQQFDGSSCGPICAEDGKDFIDKGTDSSRLKIRYEPGAVLLRLKHLNEVQDDDFVKKQWVDDRRYSDGTVKGDRTIKDKDKMIDALIAGINKLDNGSIQEFNDAFLALKEVPEALKKGTSQTSEGGGEFLKHLRMLRNRELSEKLSEEEKDFIAKLCPEGKYIKHYLECIIVQDPYMGAIRNIKSLLKKHLDMLGKIELEKVIFDKEKFTLREGVISLLEEIAVSHRDRLKQTSPEASKVAVKKLSNNVITFRSYPAFAAFSSIKIEEVEKADPAEQVFVLTSNQLSEIQQMISRITMELLDENGLKKYINHSQLLGIAPDIVISQIFNQDKIVKNDVEKTYTFILPKDMMFCIIQAIEAYYKFFLAEKVKNAMIIESSLWPVEEQAKQEKENETSLKRAADEPDIEKISDITQKSEKPTSLGIKKPEIAGSPGSDARKPTKTAQKIHAESDSESDLDSDEEELLEEDNPIQEVRESGLLSQITRIPERSTKFLEGLNLSYLPDPRKLTFKDEISYQPRLPIRKGGQEGFYTGTVDRKMQREGFGQYKTQDGTFDFRGSWHEDTPQGAGKLSEEGSVFYGEFEKEILREGFGKQIIKNAPGFRNYEYSGAFKNGKFQDLGKLIFRMEDSGELLIIADWQEGFIKTLYKNDVQSRYDTEYQEFCEVLHSMFLMEKLDPEARRQQQKHYGIMIEILKQRVSARKILDAIVKANGLPSSLKAVANRLLKLDNAFEELTKYAAKLRTANFSKKTEYDKCIHDFCSKGLLNYSIRLWLPGEVASSTGFVNLRSIFEKTVPTQLQTILMNRTSNLNFELYQFLEKSLWIDPAIIDLFHKLVKLCNERLHKIKSDNKKDFLDKQTKVLQELWEQYYATLTEPMQQLLDQERIDMYCGCYIMSLRQNIISAKNKLGNEIKTIIQEENNFVLSNLQPWIKFSSTDKQNALNVHFNKEIKVDAKSRNIFQLLLVKTLKKIETLISGYNAGDEAGREARTKVGEGAEAGTAIEIGTGKEKEVVGDILKFFIKYYESDIFLKRNTMNYETAFNDFNKLMKYIVQLAKAKKKTHVLYNHGIKIMKQFINKGEKLSELVDLLLGLNHSYFKLVKKLFLAFKTKDKLLAFETVKTLRQNIYGLLNDGSIDDKLEQNTDLFKIEIDLIHSVSDYLSLLNRLEYEWYVHKDDIIELSNDALKLEFAALFITLDKSTKYSEDYKKIKNESFGAAIKFLKEGAKQKHYILEVAASLMKLVKEGPQIRDIPQVELRRAKAELLEKICESFVYFNNPLTYSDPNQYVLDTEKTFLHIVQNNDSIQRFRNKLKRITLYLQFRKINELTVENALDMFKKSQASNGEPELTEREIAALKKAYDEYEKLFKQYIEGVLTKEKEAYTVKKIVDETRNIANQWSSRYKTLKEQAKVKDKLLCGKINQELIPQIIAGLASVLSLRASGSVDDSVVGQYTVIKDYEKSYLLKPNCIQILGIFRLLGVDMEYPLIKVEKPVPLVAEPVKEVSKPEKSPADANVIRKLTEESTAKKPESEPESEYREDPKELPNHLARILTGQGKSWATELLAGFFQLVGYRITVACYSDYLSKRDEKDFINHLAPFGWSGNYHVGFDKIQHSTFVKMCWSLVEGPQGDRLANLRRIIEGEAFVGFGGISNLSEEQILIVDEVDVFFNENFGSRLNPVLQVNSKAIQEVQQFIWIKISLGMKDRGGLLTDVLNKLEVLEKQDAILKNLKNTDLLKNSLETMIADALTISDLKNLSDDKRFVIEEHTIRVNAEMARPDTMWNYINSFFYLRFMYENNKTFDGILLDSQKYGYFLLYCGGVSYAELPRQFIGIFGMSGSLPIFQEENAMLEMYNIRKRSYYPSFFGAVNLNYDKIRDFVIRDTKETWFKEIVDRIRKVNSDRAVLVFFNDDQLLEEFYRLYSGNLPNSPSYITKNYFVDDDIASRRSYQMGDIDKLTRIKKGQIILLTSEFGRGIDYKPDLEVLSKGGVHIIQTYFSADIKEETQIKGRTARKDDHGSYELVLMLDTLKTEFASNIDLTATYDSLNKIREDQYKIACKNKLTLAKDAQLLSLHERTMKFLYDAASCSTEEDRMSFIKSIPGRKLF